MSEEQLVRDGALFFNAPDKYKRKPNVIYYNTAADTTGIEYVKPSEKKPVQKTTWFKIFISLAGLAVALAVVATIYFFVVKLRKKKEDEPKLPDDPAPLALPEDDCHEQTDVVPVVAEEPGHIQRYFESLMPGGVK